MRTVTFTSLAVTSPPGATLALGNILPRFNPLLRKFDQVQQSGEGVDVELGAVGGSDHRLIIEPRRSTLIISRLAKPFFDVDDVYEFEREYRLRHPDSKLKFKPGGASNSALQAQIDRNLQNGKAWDYGLDF